MADRRGAEDEHLIASILWAGAFLVALGIIGFLLNARLAFIWIIFLFFGVATVPQAISMAIADHRRTKRSDSTPHAAKRKRRAARRSDQ